MLNKISSMLDAVADSLEAKGLIKEAYEIDKVADWLDSRNDFLGKFWENFADKDKTKSRPGDLNRSSIKIGVPRILFNEIAFEEDPRGEYPKIPQDNKFSMPRVARGLTNLIHEDLDKKGYNSVHMGTLKEPRYRIKDSKVSPQGLDFLYTAFLDIELD
jgi:hypothetical protein